MFRLKVFSIFLVLSISLAGCAGSGTKQYSIAESRTYEASLFRQNCAICHGSEGEGRTLDTGVVVPSLRTGNFKAVTDEQIYTQIANGGNGMLGFRRQLSDREIKLLVEMVRRDLRGH